MSGRDVTSGSMLTPLLYITLPDDDGEDRHFAPIILALEAMISVNLWHIRRGLSRALQGKGNPVPPLYASGVRYKEDPPGEENWHDCLAVLKRGVGDCLPMSTLVLRDDYVLVPMVALQPGDRIMGDGAWTVVQESAVTGEKELLALKLSNGCVLRCSREHVLFRDVDGQLEEIRAGEARVGDDLLTPRSIAMAPQEDLGWPESLAKLSEQDRAWLLGVFVADGWTQTSPNKHVADRCAISGQDDKPKEAQKRRVETLLAGVDVATRWHRKYIAINDRPISEFFEKCGHHAPQKHLDSLRFASDETVRAVLEGLAADAGYSDTGNSESAIVYGTTSPQLVLQLRILYRMLGISVSVRRVDDHGGFGENPIYRVVPRLKVAPGQAERRDKKFARIRSIADGGIEMCSDITTASGKFWLPESDVLVHNCDQLCSWRVAELRAAGVAAEPLIKWQQVPKDVMIGLGHPPDMVPEEGISMVHVLVGFPGWRTRDGGTDESRVEDPSKLLGMGGEYTSGI